MTTALMNQEQEAVYMEQVDWSSEGIWTSPGIFRRKNGNSHCKKSEQTITDHTAKCPNVRWGLASITDNAEALFLFHLYILIVTS